MALSENNSNTPEAIAARDKAADLMAKYEISISKETLEFETHKREATSRTPYKHDVLVFNALSKFNGVVYVLSSSKYGKGQNIFIGRRSDIESNDYMMYIVLSQRDRKWKEFRLDFKSKHSVSPDASIRDKWLKGFGIGIVAKLQELSKIKEIKIQEYGLVIVPLYKQILQEYKKTSGVKSGRQTKIKYSQDGYNAGKSTQIHKGVRNKQTVEMIGN